MKWLFKRLVIRAIIVAIVAATGWGAQHGSGGHWNLDLGALFGHSNDRGIQFGLSFIPGDGGRSAAVQNVRTTFHPGDTIAWNARFAHSVDTTQYIQSVAQVQPDGTDMVVDTGTVYTEHSGDNGLYGQAAVSDLVGGPVTASHTFIMRYYYNGEELAEGRFNVALYPHHHRRARPRIHRTILRHRSIAVTGHQLIASCHSCPTSLVTRH